MAFSRFLPQDEEELRKLEEGRRSIRTNKAIKSGVNLFDTFLRLNNYGSMNTLSNQDLCEKLRSFFGSIKKDNGDEYKTSSLHLLHYALKTHFLSEREIDIDTNEEFQSAISVYLAKLKKLKRIGNGETDHYPCISREDMVTLFNNRHQTFDIQTPIGLLNRAWFLVMFFFSRRGRENLREMSKNTFAVKTDASGEYVYQAIGEADKNHGILDRQYHTSGEGRMYATNEHHCPVLVLSGAPCKKRVAIVQR